MIKLTKEQQDLGDKCTPLQYRVVIGMVEGLSQRQAYIKAGGTAKTENAQDNSVSVMLSNSKVAAFYDSLMSHMASVAVISRTEALEMLSKEAKVAISSKDRRGALKQLSDMEGWNSAKKHEVAAEVQITEITREIITK